MKAIALVIFIFSLLSAPPALLAQSQLSERIRNAQLQDAALRAVEESIQTLRKQVSDSTAISAELLAYPDKHRNRSTSLQLLQNEEQRRLRSAFRQQLALFAEHVPDLPEQWAQSTIGEHEQRVDAAIKPLLSYDFRKAYQSARQRVIKAQALELERSDALYAEPEEIESLVAIDTLSHTPLATLARVLDQAEGQKIVKKYADNVRRSRVLFEENESVLEHRIRITLKEQLVELQAQASAVRSFFVDLETAETIDASGLERQILQQIRPGRGHKLFPGVQHQATRRAQQIEQQLFRDFIQKQTNVKTGCIGIPAKQVQAAIADDFAVIPATASRHLAQLLETLGPPVRDELVRDYSKKLKNTSRQHQFMDRLQKLATENDAAGVADALRQGLENCAQPPLTATRNRLANKEIEHLYPDLADFSRELSEGDIERLFDQPESVLEKLALRDFPSADPLHLQESKARFAKIKLQLKQEGKFAVSSQIGLMARHQSSFEERIRQDPKRAERREFWQNAFETQVLEDWIVKRDEERSRANSRMLADEKYNDVFALTARLIADSLPIDWQPETVTSEESKNLPPEKPPPPLSCPQVVDVCAQAGEACYQALRQCAAGADCDAQLELCESARRSCMAEQISLQFSDN